MKHLIIGDPGGVTTLRMIEKGIDPSDIYVWDDQTKDRYYIKMRGATLIDDLDAFTDMKFDVVIGNPPYDGGLYQKFLADLPKTMHGNSTFSLLLPVYTLARKRCIKIFQDQLCLESVDMRAGHHFVKTIQGAWVIQIKGRLGKTDTFDITFPDGKVMKDQSFDRINPCAADFIETTTKRGLTSLTREDFDITNKVLDSSIKVTPHKEDKITQDNFVYLHPVLHRMSAKKHHRFPRYFALRGGVNDHNQNGYIVATDSLQSANDIHKILCTSKLFVYLYWLVTSDSLYTGNYIKMLPDVSGLVDTDDKSIYTHFGLTDNEIKRVESLF